jgi:protein-S-isoprenylcysteine O-methyltransferase Ste14
MDNDLVFRILTITLLVAFAAYRGYCTRRYARPQSDTLRARPLDAATRVANLLALPAFVAVVIYVAAPQLIAWAALPFPAWLRWLGLPLAALGFAVLHWAHQSLDRNWSDAPRLLRGQGLVTTGPYRWVRHPIYLAFLLILGATLPLSANALVGALWIGVTVLETASRVRFEEALLAETFGEAYRAWARQTGRLLPRRVP